MTSQEIVTLLVGVFGGSGLAALFTAITSWRKGIRENDVEKEQSTFAQMQVIVKEHRDSLSTQKADIEILKAARAEDRAELESLAEENRLYRWTLIGVTDRLRQMPPLTPKDILDYIHERIPLLRKDHDL